MIVKYCPSGVPSASKSLHVITKKKIPELAYGTVYDLNYCRPIHISNMAFIV